MKTNFNKKTPEEKVAWYRAQRSERERTQSRQVRDFTDLQVFQEETTTVKDGLQEVDQYELFDDWAARQLTLGRYDNLEECQQQWKQLMQDEDTPKIWRRGHWLVGRFTGVVASRTEENIYSNTVQQGKHITSADEMKAIIERCDEQAAKRRKAVLGRGGGGGVRFCACWAQRAVNH